MPYWTSTYRASLQKGKAEWYRYFSYRIIEKIGWDKRSFTYRGYRKEREAEGKKAIGKNGRRGEKDI